MTPNLLTEIIALPGWNTSMLMLLAKATVILIAAITMTFIMKRGSAGARHLVWLVTLGGLLLIPALTAWAPLPVAVLPPVASAGKAAPSSGPTNVDQRLPNTAQTAGPNVNIAARTELPQTKTEPESIIRIVTGISAVVTIWALVVLAILASLAYGVFLVNRIVRNSTALDSEDWLSPLYEVSDRMGLEEPPRLLRSEHAKMPFACGVFRPTIVLPSECDHWTMDRRRAVLLHELAHVRRHDLAGHTLGRLACAFYWFHPLVWTAAKQLRNESERACDDIALACGARASDYAEHLLEIVTSVKGDQTPVVALAMARRKEFEGRMLAILDPELRHSGPTKKQSFGLIASLALVSIVVGAAAPARREAKIAGDSLAIETAPVVKSEPQLADKPEPQAWNNDVETDPTVTTDVHQQISQKTSEKIATSVNEVLSENISKTASAAASIGVRAAADALGKLDLGSEEGLKALINDKKQDDRAALLANVLKTEADASLRKVAAWGLSEYADTREGETALAYALGHDSNVEVREMAAWALAESDGSGVAFDALAAAAKSDASVKVRRTAVWALGSTGEHAAVGPLTAALSDADANVRIRAVWALGNAEPKNAPSQLIAMLQDRNPEIRHLVAWSLFQIQDPAAAPALNAALKVETDKTLQLAYIRALASAGERSVDAIRGLLQSTDPQIKSMAVRALAGGRGSDPWPWPWPEPRPFP
jgi:beta-lactamase regulating signal transducer with metallopeptidase domain/HEAT repeat protein